MKEEVRVTKINRNQAAISAGETDDMTITFLGKKKATKEGGSALIVGASLKGDPAVINEMMKTLNIEKLNEVITVQFFPNKHKRLSESQDED